MAKRGSMAVALLIAAYALVYFHRTMTGVMKGQIELFAEYYGVGKGLLVSTFFSLYFYAYAASQPFTGGILDAFGTKKVCSLFLLGLSAATYIMALPSPLALVLGRALVGFFGAVVFLAAQRSASLLFGSERQATITGFLLLVGNISTALGTYPLVLFLENHGLSELLALLAVIALVMGVLMFFLSEDRGGCAKGLKAVDIYRGFKDVARDAHTWAVAFAAIAAYTVVAFQGAWGQVYFLELGIDLAVAGVYLMGLALTIAFLVPLTGYLSDVVFKKRKAFLLVSNAMITATWVLALYVYASKNQALPPVLIGALGLAFAIHVTAPPMAKEPYSVDYAAVTTAFFNIVLFTAFAVLLAISAYLPPTAMCVVGAIIGLIGFTLTSLFAKETYGCKRK